MAANFSLGTAGDQISGKAHDKDDDMSSRCSSSGSMSFVITDDVPELGTELASFMTQSQYAQVTPVFYV
jgi:hypothetical protein